MILIYRETGNLQWSTLKHRFWLRQPCSIKTGKTNLRLWWWLIPLIIVTALYELQVSGILDQLWVALFPTFAEPSNFALSSYLGSPEGQTKMVGAWSFLGLLVVSALFNTVLGEEFLFRGVLLPRMAGAFGKWDWVANGILFGLYHLHQPWMILSAALEGVFIFAFSTKRSGSAWYGIIAHSGQSVYFAFLVLGLVLGLA